jgi:hypothetical protein
MPDTGTKGAIMSDTTPFLKLLTGSFSTPAGGNPTGVMVEAAYAHHDIPARSSTATLHPHTSRMRYPEL